MHIRFLSRSIRILLLTASLGFLTQTVSTQQKDINQYDLSRIRVEELNDNQIRSFIDQAKSRGLSIQDLEADAISRGMPYSEIIKLRERIASLRQVSESQDRRRESQLRSVTPDTSEPERPIDERDEPKDDIQVFGYDLFRKDNLTFEPSLNIPTPGNYRLGPGDELIIEVWGASQQSYQQQISPEGQINLSNIGPVRVSGMMVDQASDFIISRLSAIYSGLKGPNPNTWAQVAIGNVRSIKVTVAGDVYMPGTYTLPAFATAFNALYLAGGPSERGSFRQIRVIRQGAVISHLDLYDFLIRGETSQNIRLQDEDLIFIVPYQQRAIIKGEVKRPAIYEMMDNETLGDLIVYSGGFTSSAYRKMLQVDRKTENQRMLLNVESGLFSSFLLRSGDFIDVGQILERYKNRVTVRGAVYREGEYELSEGMTLRELISISEGLREDAFLNRAAIYRLQDDLQLEVVDVNLRNIINGYSPDILLKREDLVVVSSLLDLQQERAVSIEGEVKIPGQYPYALNLSLGELVRQAGGINEAASLSRIEVARRVVNRDAVRSGNLITETFSFPLDAYLSIDDEASSFLLKPFDIVFVRRSPGYQVQMLVRVEGEVNFPGSYAISRKSERISDLVKRSGGTTDDAYIPGARLTRRVEESQISRLEGLSAIDTSELQLDLEAIVEAKEQAIGIDLENILKNPYSTHDLILEEGDVLTIPKDLQTVRLNGALLYPVTTRYQNRMGLKRYVGQAGGFADNASKSNVFVIYANGSVDQTKNYVLFRSYPRVEPGAEIIVPQKPEREARTLQETLSISSALTSLALVIVTLINRL